MFNVIIVLCSLKSMCVPSFIVIGYCVSELHVYMVAIVTYCRRLFIVVIQELHCLPNFLHVYMIIAIISPSFVTLYLMVSEIQRS